MIGILQILTVAYLLVKVVCQGLESGICGTLVVSYSGGDLSHLNLQVCIAFDGTIGIELSSHQCQQPPVLIEPRRVVVRLEVTPGPCFLVKCGNSCSRLSVKVILHVPESSLCGTPVVSDHCSQAVILNIYPCHLLIEVVFLFLCLQGNSASSLLNQSLIVFTSVHDGLRHKSDKSDIALARI